MDFELDQTAKVEKADATAQECKSCLQDESMGNTLKDAAAACAPTSKSADACLPSFQLADEKEESIATSSNEEEEDLDGRRRRRNNPWQNPVPRPRPWSRVGGTQIVVRDGKISVGRS